MSTHEENRSQVQAFVTRIQSDPELLARLKSDPVGVLQAEGMPEGMINDLVRGGVVIPDVQGYGQDPFDPDCNCTVLIITYTPT